MLFISHVLSQLAVSAKLLCLLMVVICGAAPSLVHSVKLFSASSNKFVRINDSGQVYAADRDPTAEHYLDLTIVTIDFTKLSIYSEQASRFLCFNRRWKLVGMPAARHSREETRCQFHEEMNSLGYNTYRSAANVSHFLAFNARGKPVRLHPVKGYPKKCTDFLKVGPSSKSFNNAISQHHSLLSKGNPPNSVYMYNVAEVAEVAEVARRGRITRPHRRRHKHSRMRE